MLFTFFCLIFFTFNLLFFFYLLEMDFYLMKVKSLFIPNYVTYFLTYITLEKLTTGFEWCYFHYCSVGNLKFLFFIDLREKDRERERRRFAVPHILYPVVATCLCPDGGPNLQPWRIGHDAPTN